MSSKQAYVLSSVRCACETGYSQSKHNGIADFNRNAKSLMQWERTHVKLFCNYQNKTQGYLKALVAPTTTGQGLSVCSYFDVP